ATRPLTKKPPSTTPSQHLFAHRPWVERSARQRCGARCAHGAPSTCRHLQGAKTVDPRSRGASEPARRSCRFVAPSLSLEIPGPDRGTDQIDHKPAGGDAGNAIDIEPRRDLDNVHADDAPFVDEAMNELARLMEGDAARRRSGHGRHYRGVEAVGVDGEI